LSFGVASFDKHPTIMAKVESFSQSGWTISVSKGPILNSHESEQFEKELGFHLPEMVFGNSYISFQHAESGCEFSFRVLDALRGCLHASTVKVSSAVEWTSR
jgi:type 2A phosphatase activator TIP41